MIRLALQVVTLLALSRLLSPHDFGLFSMCSVITNFALLFRDLGTSAALIQKKEINPLMLQSVFWVNSGLGLCVTVLLVALAPPVASIFHEPLLVALLPALSVIFSISGIGILPQSLLQRDMDFERIAKIETAAALIGSLAAIFSALSQWGVWSLVFQSLTLNLCSTVMFCYTKSWRPKFQFCWNEVRSITAYSLNFSGFNLVNYFSRNADNFLIGRYLGAEQLGYYDLAYKIMLFPLQNISSTVTRVAFPAFSRKQDDNEQISRLFLTVTSTIALITFPLMMGVFVIGPQAILFFLGVRWNPVIPLILVLTPIGLIQSIVSLNGTIYGSKGKTKLQFQMAILFGVLTIAGFILGLKWGILGVALAYLTVNLLILPFSLGIPLQLIQVPLRRFLSPLIPTLLCSLIMAAGLFLLNRSLIYSFIGTARLLILIVAGGVFYFMASWFGNRTLLFQTWQSIRKALFLNGSSKPCD